MNTDNLPPLTAADARTLAFAKVMDLAGDNPALIQAVAAYGAAVRADERAKGARIETAARDCLDNDRVVAMLDRFAPGILASLRTALPD